MQLKAVRAPGRQSNLAWCAVDISQTVTLDSCYQVDGHPMVGIPEIVEYALGKVNSPRLFFSRKKDVQAAIDALK